MASHTGGLIAAIRRRIEARTRMPRQLRPTRAGWGFLMIIMGVGFAALNTGNNLLYLVLSLLLAFLVLSGLLSESALRGIEVRRRLARELYAASDNRVLIEICNRQPKVPAFALILEDRAEPDSLALDRLPRERARRRRPETVGRVFALRIGPEDSVSRSYVLRPPHRGPLRFHSVRVSTRFPFGLFLKSRTIALDGDALVYPEVEARTPRDTSDRDGARSGSQRQGAGHGSLVTGIREYEPGDPMRQIHWKTSLRRGELQVRDLDDERNAEIEVRLRTRRSTTQSTTQSATRSEQADPEFEERVRWAASEVVSHLEAGMRVGLLTDDVRIAPEAGVGQRSRILNLLAEVECSEPDECQQLSVSRGAR
jgi:uncharacterized protein (DUF58 family)